MTNEKSIFKNFPKEQEILEWYKKQTDTTPPSINGHIHTPYSFSAFSDMKQPFELAKNEGVNVLGINDFYTTDGYNEFAENAQKYRIFPLFNIEFMALQNDLKEAGIRVNDPNNPGRTYFSGKGLRQPVEMSEESANQIKELQQESNRQTYQMVDKLNAFFAEKNIDIRFDAGELKERLAKNLLRERHIAQAIRIEVFEKESTEKGRKTLLQQIFSGKEVKSPVENIAAVENEIRGNLLKAGGAAFVPEDPKAFLPLDKIIDIIIDAGGIPCYPVLLDFGNEDFTDYETDKTKLMQELLKNNVHCIELIPGRNNPEILKDFVSYFHQNDFVITFGTEHNTPKLDPLKVSCGGGVELNDELKQINYDGAAIVAAHQYLFAKGKEGYLADKKAKINEKEKFIELGKAVISYFLNH